MTKFLNDQMVTQQSNGDMNMTIIQFLEEQLRDGQNDVSVTKFLDYVNRNADLETSNLLITEFLDSAVADYL